MLPHELKQAILNIQSAINGEEKVSIASFAVKLQKTSEILPEDKTIGQMALIVDRMNSGDRLFISRAEIKDLYNRLYTVSSKFPQIFASEMGVSAPETQAPSKTEEVYQEFDLYQDGDKSLLASLKMAFDPKADGFSKEIAKEAEKVVSLECSFPGLIPEVKSVSGDENVVVVAATYLTPQGQASIYIPVEIMGKRASIPSFFNGKDGQHYISRKSIASYIEGSFSKLGSYGNSSVGENVSEFKEEENKEDIETFASKLSSVGGQATFQHGDLVEKARRVISQKMIGMGKKSHQIKVLDTNSDSITYGVSCDGVAFKVPVKVEAGRVMEPSVILCNGGIESFSSEGVQNIQQSDSGVAAIVSPMFDLRPSDLVDAVREATSEGNYVKAEDALNVLANMKNATEAYQIAFSEFAAGLSAVKKEAAKIGCSRVIKTANSNQPICSHLNLPVSKTYVDKQGHCRPSYAKGQETGYDGAYFMNSKVIF